MLEICIDSVASARAAENGGADRVELCANRPEGGTTPSAGMIRMVRSVFTGGLMVIIRPRGYDFLYSEDKVEVMLHDIETARRLGADGVVIGPNLPITCSQDLHVNVTNELVETTWLPVKSEPQRVDETPILYRLDLPGGIERVLLVTSRPGKGTLEWMWSDDRGDTSSARELWQQEGTKGIIVALASLWPVPGVTPTAAASLPTSCS